MTEQAAHVEHRPAFGVEKLLRIFTGSDFFTKYAPITQILYKSDLDHFLRYLSRNGVSFLNQITDETLAKYTKESQSYTSTRRRIAAIRGFYSWSEANGFSNPDNNPVDKGHGSLKQLMKNCQQAPRFPILQNRSF